jgi:hypothetical protein
MPPVAVGVVEVILDIDLMPMFPNCHARPMGMSEAVMCCGCGPAPASRGGNDADAVPYACKCDPGGD